MHPVCLWWIHQLACPSLRHQLYKDSVMVCISRAINFAQLVQLLLMRLQVTINLLPRVEERMIPLPPRNGAAPLHPHTHTHAHRLLLCCYLKAPH
jgi:hypothetical protein